MPDIKKASVKSKVEAVMFSVGHRISIDEICKLCRSKKEEVIPALKELQAEYEQKQSSLMLVEEGDFWKFTIRDHLISIVRKIVTETELTKSVLETLAVIAFKYPILQSDLIKTRTNKAYDHLNELEASGYITRQKHGRTNLIKLTEKFFKYFDLTEEALKEKFRDFGSIAQAIKEKEEEAKRAKEEQLKRLDDMKKQDEKIKQEIESLDKSGEEFSVPLETYDAAQSGPKDAAQQQEAEKEKIGNLEVYEQQQKKEKETREKEKIDGEAEEAGQLTQDEINSSEKDEKATEGKEPLVMKKEELKEEGGIKLTKEMQSAVDKKVEEMLHPKKENDENI